MNKKKILIIAAHPDDEVLGAGGTILRHSKKGDEVSILILSDGETSKDAGINVKKRAVEAKKVAAALGVKKLFLEKLPDNKFDSVPLLEIVKKIERVISETKPEIIYTHWSGDLNIDHRLTFEAVLTACRPKPGFCVKKILSFEVLSSTEWQEKKKPDIFCPNEYVDISDAIEQKTKLMAIYKDELCEYPHPRSLGGIKVLAQYRGMEVGLKYAEAFRIIRSLGD